jgi:hypothetical protein
MAESTPPRSIGLDEFIELASGAALRSLAAQSKVAGPDVTFRPHIWIGIIASNELPQALERVQGGKSAG